jgi:hypothetical protein
MRGAHAANLWPDNTVYYDFHPNTTTTHQAAALNAMSLIEDVSAVVFVARTTEPDYVVFTDYTANNSFIGRIGGAQTINIFNWDVPFIIVHEIMHALGIYHEQSRPDRDAYVQINSGNICQDCCNDGPCDHNFAIEPTATTVGPYDFDSVMHYGQCFFSVCSDCSANPAACRTITVLPPDDVMWQDGIGQTDHFSAGDTLTIQTLYPSLSVPCTRVFGDNDGDSDSDLEDFRIFQACFDSGTGGRPECSCSDDNVDEQIDGDDIQPFVEAVHGPDVLLGACCGDGTGICTEGPETDCIASGGTYQGDGLPCGDVTCPIDEPGGCCDPDDLSCTETSAALCAAAGGIYKGNGVPCDGTDCPVEYANSSTSIQLFSPGPNIEFADDFTLAGTARNMAYYDLTVWGQGPGPFSATVSLYTDCPGNGGMLIAGTTRTFTNVPTFEEAVLSATFSPTIALPDTVWMVVSVNDANAFWVLAAEAEMGSTADVFGIDQPPWVCNAFFGGIWAGFRATIVCVD